MTNIYLQHHGILGQRWGIRRFQPYPKDHKGGKEVGEAAKPTKGERLNIKATKKLSRLDRKIQKKQNVANVHYEKAMRKSTSLFSSQKKVNREVNLATNVQRQANRLEYKGQKYYKRVEKKLGKLNSETNQELKKLGEKYISAVDNNSKSLYGAIITGGHIRY